LLSLDHTCLGPWTHLFIQILADSVTFQTILMIGFCDFICTFLVAGVIPVCVCVFYEL